jgi:hypothetical protein
MYRIDRGAEPGFAAWSPPLGEQGDCHRPSRFGFLEFTA